MNDDESRRLFVTATDTGVGKTYLTALIARSLREIGVRVGAYKPVCSGADVAPDGTVSWDDVETLVEAIGGGFDPIRVCPQRLAGSPGSARGREAGRSRSSISPPCNRAPRGGRGESTSCWSRGSAVSCAP